MLLVVRCYHGTMLRHIGFLQTQKISNIYCPQWSWGKVKFLHMSVILSTQGLPHPLPGADTPQADTPLGRTLPTWADTPLGRHHPCVDTIPGQAPPWQDTPHWQTPPWADTHPNRHPWADNPWADTPSAECMLGYSQQVGSTHPTWMQSCDIIANVASQISAVSCFIFTI